MKTLFVPGHTGEVMSLAPDEWCEVVRIAVQVSHGRAVVIPGIAHEYPVAVELARRAELLGADAVLLMPRTQPHASSPGMAAYWRGILDATSLPGVVYKKQLPDDVTLLQILGDDRVIGCKYGDTDVSRFAGTVADSGADVVWICGVAERYAPFFAMAGATGFTSGIANFAPSLSLTMQKSLEDGDMDRALRLRSACLEFEAIRAMHQDQYNVAAVKAAMRALGLPAGGVRPPLREVDDETRSRVDVLARLMQNQGAT